MRFYTTDRTVIWWYSSEGAVPLLFDVGIFRLMQKPPPDHGLYYEDAVIFECRLPGALEFITKVDFDDVLDVRHIELGPLDSPFYGRSLFYIRNIYKTEQWANRLATIDYSQEPVTVHLHANCVVDMVAAR